MAEGPDIPEPDRLDGAPHPRETTGLVGHGREERALLDAYRSGRMHHAWILGGPQGIGKATLAYRLARFVLANPDPASPAVQAARDLSVDPEHPAARRVARLAHPDLLVLRRAWSPERKTVPAEIPVAEARRAVSFFGTTAGEGGWRVCIVDAADDLNNNGANALLKVLEEPPPRALFLILSSAPRRLLPTIRSRCRMMSLRALTSAQVLEVLAGIEGMTEDLGPAELQQLAAVSEGSVRRAAEFLGGDALALRQALDTILAGLPRLDMAAVHALAERVAGRDGLEGFQLMMRLLLDWLHEQALRGAQSREPRLARWAELWDKTARAAREAEIFNLDRRPLVLAIMSDLAAAARG